MDSHDVSAGRRVRARHRVENLIRLVHAVGGARFGAQRLQNLYRRAVSRRRPVSNAQLIDVRSASRREQLGEEGVLQFLALHAAAHEEVRHCESGPGRS